MLEVIDYNGNEIFQAIEIAPNIFELGEIEEYYFLGSGIYKTKQFFKQNGLELRKVNIRELREFHGI